MIAASVAAGQALARCYRDIGRRRMAGLAVCNPALEVEAVGFRPFAGAALGVLVTPWCMTLVLTGLAGSVPRAARLRHGDTRDVAFPAGTITLTATEPEGFGPVEAASLFSPMDEFSTPALARATALEALEAVLTPPARAAGGRRGLLFGRGAAA